MNSSIWNIDIIDSNIDLKLYGWGFEMIGGFSHNSLFCLWNDRRIDCTSQRQGEDSDNKTDI